ncbi:MAG: hypothetical protein Q9168_000372 [Polycauliona sp. 1 TL-2023]
MGASSTRKEIRKRKFGSQPLSDPTTSKEIESTSASSQSSDTIPSSVEEKGPIESPPNESTGPETKSHRFVVFVGNLPYSATDESVKQHFANLKPMSVRHLHDKTSGKSKGYAFLEFNDYDRLKTCLKISHQSVFDDNISPPRLLNVELTLLRFAVASRAGGGGSKSKDRRLKLKVKNERLRQERERRAVELAKSEGESVTATESSRKKGPVREQRDDQDIHPSRRARVGPSR